MEISKVTIQDLDQILEIELKYFTGFEFYSKNALTDMLNNNDVIFIKAVKDNKIVGYLIAYQLTDHIDLYQIAVERDYFRQKIATNLENELTKYKLPICLEVAESNEAAIAFYETNGYVITKILNNYYETKSALLMRKEYGKDRN